MTALPLLSEVEKELDESGQSAWKRLLDAEKLALAPSANALVAPVAEYNNLLVGARVVGFFILDFKKHSRSVSFAECAYHKLVQQVHSCWTPTSAEEGECLKNIIDLGTQLQNHLIRAFRSNRSLVPTPSAHLSRPSFDTYKARILESLERAPSSHSTAKKQALVRDGHRCCLSGCYDVESVQAWPADVMAMAKESQPKVARTECCHIFSEGTLQSASKGEDQKDHAATAFAILRTFGLQHLVDRLNGNGVHSLENIITMDMQLHRCFDYLELWLEPQTAISVNTYNVCARPGSYVFHYSTKPREQVTFSVPDDVIRGCEAEGKQIPVLPNPDLIALHAACARVAYLSGAAKYFDMLERDAEETTVLANDGSSAYLLHGLLSIVPAYVATAD